MGNHETGSSGLVLLRQPTAPQGTSQKREVGPGSARNNGSRPEFFLRSVVLIWPCVTQIESRAPQNLHKRNPRDALYSKYRNWARENRA